jgi:hypothetical protein
MNPHFIRGEGRREYPRQSHARIDQIEPPYPESEEDVVFAFDAVDSHWQGLSGDSLLSLDPDVDPDRLRQFWQARFGGRSTDYDAGSIDPFDALPLYRIELTLRRSHPWTRMLLDAEDEWFDIELSDRGEIEVDVFDGLFTPPVTAMITHTPVPSPLSSQLSRTFSMASWPDAKHTDLDQALYQRCPLQQLLVLDVGQGLASALICNCGAAHYYFDVGCGVYRNMKTNPAVIRFCDCVDPPIILSHWDSDHWAGAAIDRSMLTRTWITPRQTLTPKHIAFANNILKAGGNILIFPPHLSPFNWGRQQRFTILTCSGTDRNGSSP